MDNYIALDKYSFEPTRSDMAKIRMCLFVLKRPYWQTATAETLIMLFPGLLAGILYSCLFKSFWFDLSFFSGRVLFLQSRHELWVQSVFEEICCRASASAWSKSLGTHKVGYWPPRRTPKEHRTVLHIKAGLGHKVSCTF